ncbi:MAG: flagellar assembly protein [Pseudomonadota bacterium]
MGTKALSSNSIIPKEQLTAYQRWELAAFEDINELAAGATPADAAQPLPPDSLPGAEPAQEEAAVEVEQPAQNIPYPTAEEMEALHQQAYQDAFGEGQKAGFEKGFEQGLSEGRQAAVNDVEQMTSVLAVLERANRDFESSMAEVVLDLALALTQQMLRQVLPVKNDILLPLIREALASLPQVNQHPRILVHPENGKVLRELLTADIAHFGLRIIDDHAIQPGGCKIEAGSSEIDATVESRWSRLLAALGRNGDWFEVS